MKQNTHYALLFSTFWESKWQVVETFIRRQVSMAEELASALLKIQHLVEYLEDINLESIAIYCDDSTTHSLTYYLLKHIKKCVPMDKDGNPIIDRDGRHAGRQGWAVRLLEEHLEKLGEMVELAVEIDSDDVTECKYSHLLEFAASMLYHMDEGCWYRMVGALLRHVKRWQGSRGLEEMLREQGAAVLQGCTMFLQEGMCITEIDDEEYGTLAYLDGNPDFGSLMLSNVLEDIGRLTLEDVEDRLGEPLQTAGEFTRDVTNLLKKVKEGALLASC
jgi:hypothetical protein